jgi:ATP-binding cassette subfamily B protein
MANAMFVDRGGRSGGLDGEAEARPLSLAIIRRLMTYTRPYALKRNVLLLITVIRACQLPALAWLLGWTMSGPIASGDGRRIVIAVVAYLGLAIVTQWMLHYRQRLAMELGESAIHDLRNDLFDHLLKMPMTFFDRTKLGRIISRMTSDAENVRLGVQDILFVSIVNGGQMLVAAAMMLWLDPVLFLIVAFLAPVMWTVNYAFRGRLSRAHRAAQESFSRVTSALAESVNGIRVTQGFVRQQRNAEQFQELVEDHSDFNMAVQRANGLFGPLMELNSQFFIAALLIVGAARVLRPGHEGDIGRLIEFFFLANVFFGPLQTMGMQYMQALEAMAGAERVFRLLDTPPDWTDRPDAHDLPTIAGRVEFQHVTFGYDPAKPVLHDVQFVAEPGQVIALVGATGSGKSSIINLIAKFYLPTRGQLLIDGHDITAITTLSLRRQMGIVLQQNYLFTGTVMDNIRVGRPTASDEEVIDAARRLDCLDLLEALPQGLNTPVGERGNSLSLGQRQLVCFTRAMLADPRILILDEATSSVDTMTEHRITKALSILLQGRTCFVVAHRLSTIRHADVVLVLADGRIVERGKHMDLLRLRGVYSRLYRQFIRASE